MIIVKQMNCNGQKFVFIYGYRIIYINGLKYQLFIIFYRQFDIEQILMVNIFKKIFKLLNEDIFF